MAKALKVCMKCLVHILFSISEGMKNTEFEGAKASILWWFDNIKRL